VSGLLQPAERAYTLSTRAGWAEFVTAPARPRPELLSPAQVQALPEQARLEYEEQRSVWHANLGPLRTPQMRRRRAINVQLADRYKGTCCAVVFVFVVRLLGLDLGVHRIAAGLVGPACRVLVDDRSALAVMPHPAGRPGPEAIS